MEKMEKKSESGADVVCQGAVFQRTCEAAFCKRKVLEKRNDWLAGKAQRIFKFNERIQKASDSTETKGEKAGPQTLPPRAGEKNAAKASYLSRAIEVSLLGEMYDDMKK